MLSNTHIDIINCTPNASDIAGKIGQIKLFFNKISHNICPQEGIANKLTHILKNNIPGEHSILHQVELSSITCGYPFGQFIIDTYFECVALYNWSINEFMKKSTLFSNIPKNSIQEIFIISYLKEYLKFISMPINNQIYDIDSVTDNDDDDEIDETLQPNHFINYKHCMRRILHYISRFKFSLPKREPQCTRKLFRQIDVIFIPKCGKMDELLGANDIEYKEINKNRLEANLRRTMETLSRSDDFSRFIILIIGDNDTYIGAEKIYLLKMPSDNTLTDILNCSELLWIYNTRNNPEWLADIIRECNGIAFSYHIHSNDIQRVYLSYSNINKQYYSSRVFKHNIINILKVFCNDIDINNIKFDKTEFSDIKYIEFINKYFSDLKLMQYDNYYRMNVLIKQYYTNMGVIYKNNFINYMNENGFNSDEQLNDILGKDIIDYNDCTIIEFDKAFPIQKKALFIRHVDRDCFIFHFLQYCYLNNIIPTQKQIINKCLSDVNHVIHNTEHDQRRMEHTEEPDYVPGDYGYKGEGGVVSYGRNNINSNNSSNKPKRHNNGNNHNSNQYNKKNNGNKRNDKNNKQDKNNNDDDKKDDDDEKKDENKKSKDKKQKGKDTKSLYRIPRKLTKQIPNIITEPIFDPYTYMIDKLRLLSVNNGIYVLRNGDRIINFGFHKKDTNEVFYAYANKIDPNSNRKFEWIFDDILYTRMDIKNKYDIDAAQLPKSLKLYSVNDIPILTNNDIQSLINNSKSIKSWAKMPVYNINTKETNKRKLTLALTIDEFKKNVRTYCHLNKNNNLIPILTCNDIEYVWIIEINKGIDIGISFKCESNHKIVTGIYLDKQTLLRRHMLINPHDCHCLDNKFISNITHLEIGNVCEKENKCKDLQHRNDKMKKEIINLKHDNDTLKRELERYKALVLEQKQSFSNDNTIIETPKLTAVDNKERDIIALPLYTTPLTDTEVNQDYEDDEIPIINNNVNSTTKMGTMSSDISVQTPITPNIYNISSSMPVMKNNVLPSQPILNLSLTPNAIPIMQTMSSDISAQTPITPSIPILQPNISNISMPASMSASQPILGAQFQQQNMLSMNGMTSRSMNGINLLSIPMISNSVNSQITQQQFYNTPSSTVGLIQNINNNTQIAQIVQQPTNVYDLYRYTQQTIDNIDMTQQQLKAQKIQCLNAINQYNQLIHYFQNAGQLNTEQQIYLLSLQQNYAMQQQRLQHINCAELFLKKQQQQNNTSNVNII